MSKLTKNQPLIAFLILIMAFYAQYRSYKRDSDYNLYKCKTKQLALRGIIDNISTRSNYMQAHLKNTDRNAFFSLNIASVKEVKGFPEDYIYQVGDSIIKKSGEKEFTIKRGKNIAVFILDCDD